MQALLTEGSGKAAGLFALDALGAVLVERKSDHHRRDAARPRNAGKRLYIGGKIPRTEIGIGGDGVIAERIAEGNAHAPVPHIKCDDLFCHIPIIAHSARKVNPLPVFLCDSLRIPTIPRRLRRHRPSPQYKRSAPQGRSFILPIP